MSKHTIDITSESFENTVQKPGIVLVDFWASWCGPCRAFSPVYENVAAGHPDITFGKVNTEEEPDISGALQINSIPTLMIFRDGVLLFAQPGMLPQSALEELIQQVKQLDMEKVRREMAEQRAKDQAESAERVG